MGCELYLDKIVTEKRKKRESQANKYSLTFTPRQNTETEREKDKFLK